MNIFKLLSEWIIEFWLAVGNACGDFLNTVVDMWAESSMPSVAVLFDQIFPVMAE